MMANERCKKHYFDIPDGCPLCEIERLLTVNSGYHERMMERHNRCQELESRLGSFRNKVFQAFGLMPDVYGEATVILREALKEMDIAVDGHAENTDSNHRKGSVVEHKMYRLVESVTTPVYQCSCGLSYGDPETRIACMAGHAKD